MAGGVRIGDYNARHLESLLWARLIKPFCQAVMFFASAALVACDASAADLPSQQQAAPSAPAPLAANPCFASVYDFLIADPDDCPLAWNGIRLYGRFDYGVGYDSTAFRSMATIPTGSKP